ncbi:AMP-binding protein [candidate division GN15 bacterium]|nr:AMP-binding protein [candidate division GN15 bacterium]
MERVLRQDTATDSLVLAIQKVAERQPDAPALIGRGGQGSRYTYAEMMRAVEQLAAGIRAQRLLEPTEVGLLSENRPEWPIAYLAILAAGGTAVPIDANLSYAEIRQLVSRAGLRVVFASKQFGPVLNEHPDSPRWISLEPDHPGNWQSLRTEDVRGIPADPSPTAVLIYTSGTTGLPKAVELTHANLLDNLDCISRSLDFYPTDVFLSILPLHHTFEATCGFLTPLTGGSSIVYARSLKSAEILEDIGNNKATIMCGVPLLFEKMYKSMRRKIAQATAARRAMFRALYSSSELGWSLKQKWGRHLFASLRNKAGLGSIRMFVSGGAAMPPEVSRFFNMLGFDLMQGYGLTECSPVVSVNRPANIRFGSVGPPLAGLEVRIDKPGPDGIGEICVRGGSVSPGYRDNPVETARMIRQGWLHTGDLGRLSEGHLWITGREKNLIVTAAGKNIYPEEIEEKLIASDLILEAVVFGNRRDKASGGEDVHAVIVPDTEAVASRLRISIDSVNPEAAATVINDEVARVNSEMAAFKRIARWRVQLEELEKTSTQKVKRYVYKR